MSAVRNGVVVALGMVLASVVSPAGAQAQPSLSVSDQSVVNGTVVVEHVVAAEPGFVMIHAEAAVAGNAGDDIGAAPVQAGETNYLVVPINTSLVTSRLYAVLHVDRGTPGLYEFPGPDVTALDASGQPVTESFRALPAGQQPASSPQAAPSVTVKDQKLVGGTAIVGQVVAPEQGWLLIHAEAPEAGNPGDMIGMAQVQPGVNTYVRVPLDMTKVTPTLYAVLHVDRGTIGTFEFPGPDVPVQSNGQMLAVSFKALPGSTASPAPGATMGPMSGAPSTLAAAATASPMAMVTAMATSAPMMTAIAAPAQAATDTPAPTTAPVATAMPAPTGTPVATMAPMATVTSTSAITASAMSAAGPPATAAPAATTMATSTSEPSAALGSVTPGATTTPSTLPTTGGDSPLALLASFTGLWILGGLGLLLLLLGSLDRFGALAKRLHRKR